MRQILSRSAAVGLALFLAGVSARSQACTDFENQMQYVGTHNVGSLTSDAVLVGDHLVVSGTFGLSVVDVSDPTAMQTVGSLSLGTSAYGIAASGSDVFVVTGATTDNLQVVDLADPTSPSPIGSVTTVAPQSAYYVKHTAYHSGKLFVPELSTTMTVVDVSNPTAPAIVPGFVVPQKLALDAVASGSYVYTVFTQAGGLNTLVIVDPTTSPPTKVGSVDFPYEYWGLSVSGSSVYLLARETPTQNAEMILMRVDASSPSVPVLDYTTFLGLYGVPGHLRVEGNRAYLFDQGCGPWILDLQSEPAITLEGPLQCGFTTRTSARVGSALLAVEGVAVRAYDTQFPLFIDAVATDPTPARTQDAIIEGDYAYLATIDGLEIVDLSDPLFPTVGSLDWAPNTDNHHQYVKSGNLIYAATDFGLRILDVTDPTAPFEKGFAPSGRIHGVVLVGNDQAVIRQGATPTGLRLVDVSDPTAPVVIDTYYGTFNHLTTSGGRVFVDGYDTDYRIFAFAINQVTKKLVMQANPTILGTPDYWTVHGTLGYQLRSGTLTVWDLQPPTPVVLGSVFAGIDPISILPSDSYEVGDLMYMVSTGGYYALDVSGTFPVTKAVAIYPGGGSWVAASDSYLLKGTTASSELMEPYCEATTVDAPVPALAGAGGGLSVRPNPARGNAVVAFAPGRDGRARVEVFDVRGRRVGDLADGIFPANGSVEWKTNGLAAGVYFVRLTTPGRKETAKVVLLR